MKSRNLLTLILFLLLVMSLVVIVIRLNDSTQSGINQLENNERLKNDVSRNIFDISIIENQGENMEGHTPRGFAGTGTGLFVGDNLNPGFPEGDGVQMFMTFDINNLELVDFGSITLRSDVAKTQGTPFENLGPLTISTIKYDTFSKALFEASPLETVCIIEEITSGTLICEVAEVVNKALENGQDKIQFIFKFKKAGNSDGQPDLLQFYNTNSNTNEAGLFRLDIGDSDSEEKSIKITVPVILNLIKNNGVSTNRNKTDVLSLFAETEKIWAQANIFFDITVREITLSESARSGLKIGNFDALRPYADETAVNIFFTKTLLGPNGIAIFPDMGLVADITSVNSFRATAHEIGHLLGLSHTPSDPQRLLYSGTNGTNLTENEILISREGTARFLLQVE